MEAPVKEVDARCVSPAVAAFVLEYVVQVVFALPKDRAVRIEGHSAAFRINKVVGGTKRIGKGNFAQRPLPLH